jgi:FKBP-type peptidyl-prolyl cis-trans isomerase
MMRWVLGLLVIAVLGCGKDEPEIYDPEAQLEIDIQNIDDYLAGESISATVDEETGIRYVITQQGPEEIFPEIGDSVFVDYALYNFEGELLDTSVDSIARAGNIYNIDRTYRPLEFILGTRNLITGFQRGTQLLTEGGAGDFYIPSVYAYQNRGTGSGSIAPNESILFKIELLSIKRRQ